MVQRPIFLGDRCIAWVVMSAHMMDMGGMVVGSFAPAATECYQEALRCPPVRLFRAGRGGHRGVGDLPHQHAAWRSWSRWTCGASSPAATSRTSGSSRWSSVGAERFVEASARSATSPRPRCAAGSRQLEDGVVPGTSWTEWDDDFFRVPCRLTVDGDRLVFDFDGASPQTNHFFNSKPYIIESELVVMLAGGSRATCLQRGHLRADRAALPRGDDRQRAAAGADRGRAHARRAQCGRTSRSSASRWRCGVARRAAAGSTHGHRGESALGQPHLVVDGPDGNPTRSSCSTATGSAAPPAPSATASTSGATSSDASSGHRSPTSRCSSRGIRCCSARRGRGRGVTARASTGPAAAT